LKLGGPDAKEVIDSTMAPTPANVIPAKAGIQEGWGGGAVDSRRPLADLSHAELSAWLDVRGLLVYRADQIRRWLFQKHATAFDGMTDVPRELREALAREFVVGSLAVQQERRSGDGTVKYLFRLSDGAVVETVYIPEPDRVAPTATGVSQGSESGCLRDSGDRNLLAAAPGHQLLVAGRA